ncbi:hypothetical protein BGZ60DRAFT_158706 [Tricladium varicosporioides]|nr:hypothetical protein BGZ60DRAFT_158706 [Hymenoscyphus varicosporioides]
MRAFPKIECFRAVSRSRTLGNYGELLSDGEKIDITIRLSMWASCAVAIFCSRVSDKMSENIFQNQVRLDDTVYDLHPDQTMTFDLATNAAIDKPFDTISNEIWLDSIAWDAYFDGQMALSSVVDDFMEDDTSSSREHVWPDSIACESFLDNPMTSTAVGGDTFHVHNQDSPDHITCDSHVNDELLTVNLATETIKDDILDINYMVCDSNPDEPASREFQKWKEGWDEKMSLVRWKREGKGWDDITKAFQKLGVQKGSGGWKSMLVRAESEVSLLSFRNVNPS